MSRADLIVIYINFVDLFHSQCLLNLREKLKENKTIDFTGN